MNSSCLHYNNPYGLRGLLINLDNNQTVGNDNSSSTERDTSPKYVSGGEPCSDGLIFSGINSVPADAECRLICQRQRLLCGRISLNSECEVVMPVTSFAGRPVDSVI